jgi:hypothetical protein
VRLRHNVGMLITRQEHETDGKLCAKCLGLAFRKHQLSNLIFGWWGAISFIMTWFYLFDNFRAYFAAKNDLARMADRREGAGFVPEGTASERLTPFRHNVRLRLRRDEDAARIAADLAATHHVPLADAQAFVQELIDSEFADAPEAAPL